MLWIEGGLEVGEPQRSFRCLPPASTLAWALPPIELGYALHDLVRARARVRVRVRVRTPLRRCSARARVRVRLGLERLCVLG